MPSPPDSGVINLRLNDLIERTGVDEAFVVRLVDLGIIIANEGDAFAAGDVPRVRLLRTLESGGVPMDAVASAVRNGYLSLAFMDQPFYARFAALTPLTFEDLANETAVPVELLMVVREAIGFGAPRPQDRVREDELPIVTMLRRLLETGSRPTVVERLIRVYGESMRRIADVEGDWWRSEIEMPLLESGLDEAQMMAESHRLSSELAALEETALLEIYHAHHEHAATRNIIDDIESALAKAGVYSRVDRPPAICFLDLTGYTRLTEEKGDAEAAELAGRLSRLVRRTAVQHRGKPVKWLGDGVMFYFPEARGAVLAALEMVRQAVAAGLPPARVGVHAGPVLFQEGDYFGKTVNVAARIADFARPGEVLVSRDVVEAVGADVGFASIGPVELKGVSQAIELYAITKSMASEEAVPTAKRP